MCLGSDLPLGVGLVRLGLRAAQAFCSVGVAGRERDGKGGAAEDVLGFQVLQEGREEYVPHGRRAVASGKVKCSQVVASGRSNGVLRTGSGEHGLHDGNLSNKAGVVEGRKTVLVPRREVRACVQQGVEGFEVALPSSVVQSCLLVRISLGLVAASLDQDLESVHLNVLALKSPVERSAACLVLGVDVCACRNDHRNDGAVTVGDCVMERSLQRRIDCSHVCRQREKSLRE
mmetsp:Transcript_8336/g.34932  ORF Transcript_8336/g.34932 Transcript_8336/m.34932 type:complete len:231 (+) Transcript_8336:53-745(+)